jgi:hypothetical protein
VLFGKTAEMPDDAEKRMSRLRDELADICQDYKQLWFWPAVENLIQQL